MLYKVVGTKHTYMLHVYCHIVCVSSFLILLLHFAVYIFLGVII